MKGLELWGEDLNLSVESIFCFATKETREIGQSLTGKQHQDKSLVLMRKGTVYLCSNEDDPAETRQADTVEEAWRVVQMWTWPRKGDLMHRQED